MNVFQQVQFDYGVNDQTHGEGALIYAILKLGGYDVEGSNIESNPVREVLRRLEVAGIGKIALDHLRHRFNSLENKYDR